MDDFQDEDITIEINLGSLTQGIDGQKSQNIMSLKFKLKSKDHPQLWIHCYTTGKSSSPVTFILQADELSVLKKLVEKADEYFKKAKKSGFSDLGFPT